MRPINSPQSQVIMEGIDSPHIEPQSINALSTKFPFINMPSRPTSEMSQILSLLPHDGPPSLPHIEHTGPPEIITVHQPLMNPQLQNYNDFQKRRVKSFVDIKVKLASKTLKQTDVEPGILDDLRYLGVSHIFDILDNLEASDRSKLREVLSKALNQDIPIIKHKWKENTGALIKGLVDADIAFDTNTTWDDIQNELLIN